MRSTASPSALYFRCSRRCAHYTRAEPRSQGFWPLAMAHSIDVLDRVIPPPSQALLACSSYEDLTGVRPRIMSIQPWGCRTWALTPARTCSKPDPNAVEVANLGRSERQPEHTSYGFPTSSGPFPQATPPSTRLVFHIGRRTNSAWIALFLTPSMVTQISLRRCPPQLEPRRTASPATPLQQIFFAPPVPRQSSLLELESSAYPGAYCSSPAARTRYRTASSRTSSAMTSRSCRSTTTRIRRQEPRYTHRQFLLRPASSRPTMRVLSGMGRATMLYLQYRPLPARGTRIRRRATGRTTSISGPGAQVERADSAHNQHPASGTQCRVGIRHRIPG